MHGRMDERRSGKRVWAELGEPPPRSARFGETWRRLVPNSNAVDPPCDEHVASKLACFLLERGDDLFPFGLDDASEDDCLRNGQHLNDPDRSVWLTGSVVFVYFGEALAGARARFGLGWNPVRVNASGGVVSAPAIGGGNRHDDAMASSETKSPGHGFPVAGPEPARVCHATSSAVYTPHRNLRVQQFGAP